MDVPVGYARGLCTSGIDSPSLATRCLVSRLFHSGMDIEHQAIRMVWGAFLQYLPVALAPVGHGLLYPPMVWLGHRCLGLSSDPHICGSLLSICGDTDKAPWFTGVAIERWETTHSRTKDAGCRGCRCSSSLCIRPT